MPSWASNCVDQDLGMEIVSDANGSSSDLDSVATSLLIFCILGTTYVVMVALPITVGILFALCYCCSRFCSVGGGDAVVDTLKLNCEETPSQCSKFFKAYMFLN